MFKNLLLLLVCSFWGLSPSFTQAQVEVGVDSVLAALDKGSDNFTGLNTALEDLRAKANQRFTKQQNEINAERIRLKNIEIELAKDIEREAQMMYDEWIDRAKANTKLMQEKELLHEKELSLKMEKVVFKDQIKQAEQKLLGTLGNQLKEQLDYHNTRMKLLKQQLQEVEQLKKSVESGNN